MKIHEAQQVNSIRFHRIYSGVENYDIFFKLRVIGHILEPTLFFMDIREMFSLIDLNKEVGNDYR